MAIDIYSVPAEQRTYIRDNLFTDPTSQVSNDGVGVNIYQDFIFTKLYDVFSVGMTTGAAVVLNHFVDLGFFCSYYFPKVKDLEFKNDTSIYIQGDPKFHYKTYAFCGGTLGYTPIPEKIVHPRIGLDVGLGNTSATITYKSAPKEPSSITFPYLIFRPTINMEVNIYSFIQWRLGLGYRFQVTAASQNIKDEALGGSSSHADRAMSSLEVSTGIVFNAR